MQLQGARAGFGINMTVSQWGAAGAVGFEIGHDIVVPRDVQMGQGRE